MFLETEVRQLVETVWLETLHLPVEPADHEASDEPEDRQVTAYVHVAGQWNGTVALTSPGTLAAKIAMSMFDILPESVTPRDVQDALGEIANVLGGNIKALLPSPSHLSLPTVVDGADYLAGVPGSRTLARYHHVSDGQTFSITILEKDPAAVGRSRATTMALTK